MQDSMFIGLDVHKATISFAVAQGGRGGEVRHWGTVPHRPDHVRKLVDKLGAVGGKLYFCYEAAPCGYGLHRQLAELGHDCTVVAPSLIPVKAGDRVKTDRRNAVMLAKLTGQIAELLPDWELAPVVEPVQAMRCVAFIVAFTVLAEVGDFNRFGNPRQLMTYLGLTPSERSSGATLRRGGITKAGRGLARRALARTSSRALRCSWRGSQTGMRRTIAR